MAATQPPSQPVRPPACANCATEAVVAHCANPRCPWSSCTLPACRQISGFVLGRLRHIPNLYPGRQEGHT